MQVKLKKQLTLLEIGEKRTKYDTNRRRETVSVAIDLISNY